MASTKQVVQHYLSMYECWGSVREKAHKKELINLDESHNARGLIAERIWMKKLRLK